MEISSVFKKGDRIDYDFGVGLHVQKPHNKNSVEGVHSFRHGPMMLVVEQGLHDEEGKPPASAQLPKRALGPDTTFEKLGDARYRSKTRTPVILTPIFDIRSLTERWHARQALFSS
jgi:hypothetical protein